MRDTRSTAHRIVDGLVLQLRELEATQMRMMFVTMERTEEVSVARHQAHSELVALCQRLQAQWDVELTRA